MEEVLTLEELYLLYDAMQDARYNHNKFLAAIQGVDLEDNGSDKFEEIQRRAEAELAGKSEEQHVFDIIGIEVEADDD